MFIINWCFIYFVICLILIIICLILVIIEKIYGCYYHCKGWFQRKRENRRWRQWRHTYHTPFWKRIKEKREEKNRAKWKGEEPFPNNNSFYKGFYQRGFYYKYNWSSDTSYETENKKNSQYGKFSFSDCHTKAEARALYHKLAKKYHPDNGGDEKILKKITEEYNRSMQSFG